MTANGTYLGPTAFAATLSALLGLVPVSALSQSSGNPWNPFPLQAPIPTRPAPVPSYAGDAPVQRPQPMPQQQPQTRDRYAPPGLEQALSASPYLQPAPTIAQPAPGTGAVGSTMGSLPGISAVPVMPPTYATPAPGGYPQGYAPPPPAGYGYGGYNNGYGGYGGYAPGYGGYSAPYGGNGYPGYGATTPFSPFGFPGGIPGGYPGGTGGFGPFPGNITNGGVPGFNLSPFGSF